MKFKYDLHGHSEIYRDIPVFGAAADLEEGAVVIRGATPGTNQPFAILGTGALTDVLGVMMEEHVNTVSGDDSNVGGTNYTRKKVLINPFAVFEAEYDQADTMAVVSTSTTTVTITSLEDNIDGGYVYAVGGTGLGRLAFITASAAGSCVTKETTAWDSTTTLIKILPLFHQLIKISNAGRSLGTDAAAGTGEVTILENLIQADSIGKATLDPKKHSGLTGLNDKNVKFYAELIFRNHFLNTID